MEKRLNVMSNYIEMGISTQYPFVIAINSEKKKKRFFPANKELIILIAFFIHFKGVKGEAQIIISKYTSQYYRAFSSIFEKKDCLLYSRNHSFLL